MDKPFTAKMSFAGRTALVTGGASGIGFAVARQLAELNVGCVGNITFPGLRNQSLPGNTIAVKLDELPALC